MIHLKSAMNCFTLKTCLNAEPIADEKNVLGEQCTCLQLMHLEDWDIILQRLALREWLICHATWLYLSPRLPVRQSAPSVQSWLRSDLFSVLFNEPEGNFHGLMKPDKYHPVLHLFPSLHSGSRPGCHWINRQLLTLHRKPSFWPFPNSRELNFTNFGIVFVNVISRKGIRLPLLRWNVFNKWIFSDSAFSPLHYHASFTTSERYSLPFYFSLKSLYCNTGNDKNKIPP